MVVLSYSEADPITWYALQHYRNMVASWLNRKRSYSVLSLQYTVLQYCDMYSVGNDRDNCRGLARAIYSLCAESIGKAPRSFKDIEEWFRYSGYVVLGPGLSYVIDDLDAFIARASDKDKGE